MPLLDVVHLFFEPIVTLEAADGRSRASIFGKEWQMTLQYVLNQLGLNAAYTSNLGLQHDVWVLLGNSLLSMMAPPAVADSLC